MDRKEALASLEAIRNILERSTRFTHIAPGGIIAVGIVAIIAAAAGARLEIGPERPREFLLLWGTALLLALGIGVGASALRARRRAETFWSRKLQYVVAGFVPAAVGASILTAAFYEADSLRFCPGAWMVCYGVAILAVGVVLDWEFRATAWAFLIAGSASLFVLRDHPHLCLGSAFGGLHVALGALRFTMEGVGAWRARTPSYGSRS